jgi:ATP-dependent Clp protease ATP-binding subunit ClpB
LAKLLQATEKEAIKRADQFVASELFLLALADAKSALGDAARANGLTRKTWKLRLMRCAAGRTSTAPMPKTSANR